MFELVWDSDDFGKRFKRAGHETVKARYNTLAEAVAQGDHDLKLGRHPIHVKNVVTQEIAHSWDGHTSS